MLLRLAVLSSAATGCRRTRFTFGESCEGCQVWAGSRQIGTTALLLLPTAFGTTTDAVAFGCSEKAADSRVSTVHDWRSVDEEEVVEVRGR
ncbi:hypothetical protein INR49_004381 [Caranx melampygus]|nr:hypothetical protein INR49_004381 [Caranx melampygus]